MERLSEKEILSRLQKLNGWTLNQGAIESNYELADFNEALSLINDIGRLSEDANHHPELHNIYNKVTVRLWTHDADGITQKDFDLAEKISELR